MTARAIRKLIASTAIASLAALVAVPAARAVPVNGLYLEDARCDALPNQTLSHELGVSPPFPANESIIQFTSTPAQTTVCVPNDGLANDWIVSIQNTSGLAWRDRYFECKQGATAGNADGTVVDLVGAPNVPTDAFKIDGTVTLGLNNNLLTETINPNEIFEPGEIWRFNVSNFMAIGPAGGFLSPNFATPGVFAGSWPVDSVGNNASILAIPVPEPTTVGAMIVATAALLMRRPRRA
jgi:hypothetical protein